MLKNKNMPLATEGNYKDSPSDELVSGNEQSHVNEQPPVDDANTKREVPKEQLAALEKYGLPRKDAKSKVGKNRVKSQERSRGEEERKKKKRQRRAPRPDRQVVGAERTAKKNTAPETKKRAIRLFLLAGV